MIKSKKNDTRQWILPPPETEGTIKEESSGQFLTVRQKTSCDFGKKTHLQDIGEMQFTCKHLSDTQQWFRSKSDAAGYFTLKNIATAKLLTAKSSKTYELTGTFYWLLES